MSPKRQRRVVWGAGGGTWGRGALPLSRLRTPRARMEPSHSGAAHACGVVPRPQVPPPPRPSAQIEVLVDARETMAEAQGRSMILRGRFGRSLAAAPRGIVSVAGSPSLT